MEDFSRVVGVAYREAVATTRIGGTQSTKTNLGLAVLV